MLALATAKHVEAMNAISTQPVDLDRVKDAERALADAELLAEDCLDLTGDERLADALTELQAQRSLLARGIARLEAQRAQKQQRSPWATAWPWLSLAVIFIALAIGYT